MTHESAIKPLIMLVEDNPLIVEFVEAHLRRHHFDVVVAEGCGEALVLLQQHTPELVVMDIVLDDGLGYELCGAIRSGGAEGSLARLADLPVLFLTARADENDRLKGFQVGADDYVTKPFSPEELVCRIQAVIRRSRGVRRALIKIGPLQIDPKQRQALINEAPITLAPKEFDLLHLLASRPGQIFSREDLLERIWGYSFFGNTRTVDVHVNRLRQKLASYDEQCGKMIGTEWGVGYKLVPPCDVTPAQLTPVA
jgi:DNA-binding response OmpR family regulator